MNQKKGEMLCKNFFLCVKSFFLSFPTLPNDNLLRAFRGAPTNRTPLWVHRQAGRHMTDYKAVRQHVTNFVLAQWRIKQI